MTIAKEKSRRKIARAIAYLNGRLPADKSTFVREWLERETESSRASWVYLAFHLASLALEPLIMDRPFSYLVLRYFHILCVLSFVVLKSIFGPKSPQYLSISLYLQLIGITGYLYLLRVYLIEENGVGLLTLKAWTGVILVAGMQVGLWPGHNIRHRLVLSVVTMTLFILTVHDLPVARPLIPMAVAMVLSCTVYAINAVFQTINVALREFDLRQLKHEHEHARKNFEMEMARTIQHSMALPREAQIGDYQVYCFQSMHEVVGGDWAGAREDREGNLYVAVADAAGKGLQAALVVHSVQSLWAEHLNSPEFDPANWIESLNRTVFELGRDEIHMITIGITKISRDRIEYWGAGHLPLYIAVSPQNAQNQVRLETLTSRANPLGIQPKITVTASTYEFGPDETFELINFTDGVDFLRGRRSKKAILQIYEQLRTKGEGILEAIPASDDRTIMWIKKDVA